MKQASIFFTFLFCLSLFINAQDNPKDDVNQGIKTPDFVLAFTKTTGYRHKSIEKGVHTLRQLGRKNNFIVLQTETSEDFNAQNLLIF